MGNKESLPAQEYQAPFRVDKTGLARRDEWKELSNDISYQQDLESRIAAAGTAGSVIAAAEIGIDQVA